MSDHFSQTLQQYARLAIQIGLNLQAGQRLFIKGAPVEAAPFIRQLAEQAYRAGARLVNIYWQDDAIELSRFRYAPHDSFNEYPTWLSDGLLQAAQAGDAILSLRGSDPDLLKDADPELVGLAQKVRWQHLRPALDITGRNGTNWLVVAAPVPGWAAKVFPYLNSEQALAKLWEMIFHICRLDQPDPVTAWKGHIAQLAARRDYMNERRYTALHYQGPGTDLKIGLPDGHLWKGASSFTQNGIEFIANMPTEEIFTMPHRAHVEGVVTASMPLSYNSTLIEDFSLTFAKGRVVEFSARRGEEVLRKLIETDEGAARLGEVALVPHNSPIADTGILFYDGLIDENAACHIALGSAYPITLQAGESLSTEDFIAAGGNKSLVHVDFMVGSNRLDIDGIRQDGVVEAIFREGEWAFTV